MSRKGSAKSAAGGNFATPKAGSGPALAGEVILFSMI
jgi:hypothetical protein